MEHQERVVKPKTHGQLLREAGIEVGVNDHRSLTEIARAFGLISMADSVATVSQPRPY